MRIVATNRIIDAQARYPSAHEHLKGWFQIVSQTNFESADDLRKVFGDMRGFNTSFKFPIPESNLLAHTLINFNANVMLIEQVIPGNH